MPCCPLISPQCFHLWFSSDCYCRKSILKAMMTQQQATQGLFRSPGENKCILSSRLHCLLRCINMMREKVLNVDLPILAHFQKIPRSLKDKIEKLHSLSIKVGGWGGQVALSLVTAEANGAFGPLCFWCVCWTLWGCVCLQACLCTNFQTDQMASAPHWDFILLI